MCACACARLQSEPIHYRGHALWSNWTPSGQNWDEGDRCSGLTYQLAAPPANRPSPPANPPCSPANLPQPILCPLQPNLPSLQSNHPGQSSLRRHRRCARLLTFRPMCSPFDQPQTGLPQIRLSPRSPPLRLCFYTRSARAARIAPTHGFFESYEAGRRPLNRWVQVDTLVGSSRLVVFDPLTWGWGWP